VSLGRFVGFGEILLRLEARPPRRLVQEEELVARYTGSEANIAVMLAGLGIETRAVSRVPGHDMGTACLNQLRRYGVDTSHVLRGGERLGVLYVELGTGIRPTRVIYDRGHSGFATLDPRELDWDRILDGAAWLHVSGTALAVGAGPARAVEEGFRAARARGVRTSLDCNYRSALWSRDAMRDALTPLLPLVTLFVGSSADAALLCGEEAGAGAAADLARTWGGRLERRFGIGLAGFTVREDLPTGINRLTGYLAAGSAARASRTYETAVADRIGSGDAFTGGLVYGLLRGEPLDVTVELAAAAACLKLTLPGDFALLSREELDRAAAATPPGVLR
jgi:2-dehydro-3-deoxygluconokinase